MMKITRKTHNMPTVYRTSAAPPQEYAVRNDKGRPLDRLGVMLFIMLSVLVVLLGGVLTLFWQEQQHQVSNAAGDIVVGPPSLPATTVDAIFTRMGSPMAGTGQVVEEASRHTNIDDAFALAVWWAETNDGMAGVGRGYHNPGGVQGSPNYPSKGYTIYPSYAAAVTDWFNILQSRYISRGLTSVYTICYPYVGTSGALNWANKVMNYMSSYRASAPPPTPTPTVAQTPVPTPAGVVKTQINTISEKKTQQVTQPVTSTLFNLHATNTQLLLTGMGLLTALLLAVPALLIRKKRRTIGQPLTGISISGLTFEPGPATDSLSVTTTLRLEAISTQQLKPLYMSQYSPVLECEDVNAINTSQLSFEPSVLPNIPASPLFRKPILQPVADGAVAVPPTPIQHVPVTPLFRGIPVTPLLSHSSQGGLLARYNMQNSPLSNDLTRPAETKNLHTETYYQQ